MVQRMGMVIGLHPEKVSDYKTLHAKPWPEMDAALKAANIGNYSIFLREPENLLFGYWEYSGTDYATDMARLGVTEITQRWLALTAPCQRPLDSAAANDWWSFLPMVYYLE